MNYHAEFKGAMSVLFGAAIGLFCLPLAASALRTDLRTAALGWRSVPAAVGLILSLPGLVPYLACFASLAGY